MWPNMALAKVEIVIIFTPGWADLSQSLVGKRWCGVNGWRHFTGKMLGLLLAADPCTGCRSHTLSIYLWMEELKLQSEL